MRGLKFFLAVLVALAVHFLAAGFFPGFPAYADLFLVIVVFHALDGHLLAGLLGGFAAGLVTDGLTGGLFGLFGFADTLVGYGAALATKRVVIEHTPGAFVLFGVAALAQQAILALLSLTLLAGSPLPGTLEVGAKVLTTGVLGAALFFGRGRLTGISARWRKMRQGRIRFGR